MRSDILQERRQFGNIHACHLGDILARDAITECLLLQSLPVADGTFHPRYLGIVFLIIVLLSDVLEHTLVPVGIVVYDVAHRSLVLLDGGVGTHAPQALAAWAPALRRVERERVGCRFAVREPCGRAHEVAREITGCNIGCIGSTHNHHHAVALRHGLVHRLPEPLDIRLGCCPLQVRRRHFQSVDDHFDGVVAIAVHLHTRGDVHHFAVHPHTQVPLAADSLEEFLVVPLAVVHQRGKDKHLLPCIVAEQQVHYLLVGVAHHLLARQVGICLTCPRKEQSQVVVNLCNGTHRTARVAAGGLLVDTDDGRKPRNLVHIGALHGADIPPRVG